MSVVGRSRCTEEVVSANRIHYLIALMQRQGLLRQGLRTIDVYISLKPLLMAQCTGCVLCSSRTEAASGTSSGARLLSFLQGAVRVHVMLSRSICAARSMGCVRRTVPKLWGNRG